MCNPFWIHWMNRHRHTGKHHHPIQKRRPASLCGSNMCQAQIQYFTCISAISIHFQSHYRSNQPTTCSSANARVPSTTTPTTCGASINGGLFWFSTLKNENVHGYVTIEGKRFQIFRPLCTNKTFFNHPPTIRQPHLIANWIKVIITTAFVDLPLSIWKMYSRSHQINSNRTGRVEKLRSKRKWRQTKRKISNT